MVWAYLKEVVACPFCLLLPCKGLSGFAESVCFKLCRALQMIPNVAFGTVETSSCNDRAQYFVQPQVRSARRLVGRRAGRPAGRSSVAPMSSAALQKKVFDRGGPVWPPRSNAADDRLGGWSGGALPTQPKTGGDPVWGSAPPSPNRKIRKNMINGESHS